MTEALDPSHVAWCRTHFEMLNEGGIWAIPRSGLVFRKQDGRFVLVAQMPWTPELEEAARAGLDVPLSAEELRWYQDEEFEANRRHFGAAGIEVVRSPELEREEGGSE